MSQESILTFSEDSETALELLGQGRMLAQELGCRVGGVALGSSAKERADELIYHGADYVYTIQNPVLDHFSAEIYSDALSEIGGQAKPKAILIGDTRNGKELAPRVAVKLKTGCISECIKLSVDANKDLLIDRFVYGGNGIATLTCRTKPVVIGIPPHTREKLARDESRKGEVLETQLQIKEARVRCVNVFEKQKGAVNLKEARVVVSAGRGVRKKEDLAIIEELANLLGGAVGGSRPLTQDFKWLPEDRQVGLSGTTVNPQLYIAVGISGQIQHVTGIRDSKVIVAINTDEKAPIFDEVDYGIVGNLYIIVPALTAALKRTLKR